MLFEYNLQKQYENSIEIEDIGNAAIQCITDMETEYYLVTRTIMGKTMILKFGPVYSDIPMLLDGFNISYKKIDYKEKLIHKEFDLLINDPKKKVLTVNEITMAEAESAIPAIERFFADEDALALEEDEF